MLIGAVAAGAATTSGVVLSADPASADVFTDLRDRWCDIITGASHIDLAQPEFQAALAYLTSRVNGYLALIDRSSNRTRVFTDQPLDSVTNSNPMTDTYNGLRWMALGWYTPGSVHYRHTGLRADILAGLATVDKMVYHIGGRRFGNWWNFEVGSPKRLADILLLMDTELSATVRQRYTGAIRHFIPHPLLHDGQPTTGANRTAIAGLCVIEGIASRDSARISLAVSGLPETCRYVTGDKPDGSPGEGLWADGSFVQHRHAYTGSYGRGFIGDLAVLTALLAGTSWALDGPEFQNLYTAVDQAFAPVMHDGRMMGFVNGRMASEAAEQEHQCAIPVIGAILRMARGNVTDADTLRRWRGRCRGWIERSSYSPFTGGDPARVGLMKELLDSEVPALPEPEDSVIFRNMARAVHRRNGWAFAISMNSNRIARYESINGDNLRGFHTGAGMTYLYDGDNTQYTDGFWPTVDPYRLAGTTVDRRPLADSAGQTMSPWKWAGGAVLDAKYSAVGMSLQAATTDLVGKKSWFCFDELIFCMGRSISGGSGYAVETIVENRNLHQDGTNRLLINGTEWTSTDQTLAGVAWAHIEGVGGYVFPASAGQSVRFQRTTRAGRWRDINADGSTTSMNRRFLTLAVQHGTNPADGLYAYLVVPKATPQRTAQLSADRGVGVVGHNSKCHAVHQLSTGITMINFWDGPHTCPLTQAGGSVTVDRDCAVIVQERDNTLKIVVAEPLRSDSTVRVTVTPIHTGYRLVRKEDRVTVVSVGASIVLDIAVSVYGRSYVAEFSRAV